MSNGSGRQASIIATSYEFHKGLESPMEFFRREWQSFVVFGGGFVVVLVVAVLAVSPAYYYPRLSTDPLLYYLKGLAFAHTGHTAAQSAVNRPPFPYVSMPGVLRSPFMIAFKDFDMQLRAIQLSNIVMVAATAALYAYVLSWVVPKKWHWLAIGFSFGFLLISPDWVANVFGPLADAPYAFFTILFVVLSVRLLTSGRPLRRRLVPVIVAALCFVIAFTIRFTAPVLLAYAIVLRAGRHSEHPIRKSVLFVEVAVAVIAVVALIGLNWEPIRDKYLIEPYSFLLHSNKFGVLMNLVASALPTQLIPDFQLGFGSLPIIYVWRNRGATSFSDSVLFGLGMAISVLTLVGVWRARRHFAPEIAYTIAGVPVLALMIPSTARYLMSYQPFFWIFFYIGASVVFAPITQRVAQFPRASYLWMLTLLLTASGLIYLRSSRVAGAWSERKFAISIGNSRAYVGEVASTFNALRQFLETLPRNRTLLIGAPGTYGRWKVISGLDYYRPDSALSLAAASHETYLVVECGTLEVCQAFDNWDEQFRQGFQKYGAFTFEPVFSRIAQHAKARVYRVRNVSE